MALTKNIIIADSSTQFRAMVVGLLQEDLTVLEAETSEQCFDLVEKNEPDLIIIDTELMDLDGFETYKTLQASYPDRNYPVIFTSNDYAADERLVGYNLGCLDFLSKPIDAQDLRWKILLRLRLLDQRKELELKAKAAEQAAFSAMRANSELGIIIKFMEFASGIEEPASFVDCLLSTLNDFELVGCIQLRLPDQILNAGHGCDNQSVEAKMLSAAKDKGKVVGDRARVFFNNAYVSILVKNMPYLETELSGRLRDNLVVLVNAANTIVNAIALKQQVQQKNITNVSAILKQGKKELDTVIKLMHHHSEVTTNTFRQMQWNLEEKLLALGLSEVQEKSIMCELEQSSILIEQSQAQADKIEETFNAVINRFSEYLV